MPVKDIKHKIYNNKSRKGEYIEITTEYNGKTRRHQYKWDPRKPYDWYIERAKSEIKGHKQFNKEWTKATQGQKSKITNQWSDFKKKQIKTEFRKMKDKKAITQTHYWEEAKTNPNKIYEELFRPLVLDKDILKLVIKNKEKIKYKMKADIWITSRNESGQTQSEQTEITVTGKTLEEIQEQLGKYLDKNSVYNLEEMKKDESKGRLRIIDFKTSTNNPSKEQFTTTHTYFKMRFG